MSCNTIIFDRQLTQQEVENITIEGIEKIFQEYVNNSLGENFEFKDGIYKVVGTPTNLHHKLIKDLNDKLGFKVLFNQGDYTNYQFNQIEVGKLLQASMEMLTKTYHTIDNANIFEDVSDTTEFQDEIQENFTNDVSEESIEKYVEYLEQKKSNHIVRTAEINKEIREINRNIKEARKQNDVDFVRDKLKDVQKLEKEKQQIQSILKGDPTANIKSIDDNINYLKDPDNQTFEVLNSLAEKDLKRLNQLVTNGFVGKEAFDIVEFYLIAFDFTNELNNPIFTKEQLKDLNQSVKDKLRVLKGNFEDVKNTLAITEQHRVTAIIKENIQLNKFSAREIFSKIFKEEMEESSVILPKEEQEWKDFETLRAKLFEKQVGDTSTASMLLLDISTSFGKVGYAPKLILSELDNDISEAWATIGQMTEEFEQQHKKVEKELGKNKKNFLIFKQRNKTTNKLTGNLITRFSYEFNEKLEDLENAIKRNFKSAKANKAEFLKNNTIAIDISVLPEIQNAFKGKFNNNLFKDDKGKHKQKLISLLGEKGYQEIIQEQINKIQDFLIRKNAIRENLVHEYGDGKNDTTFDELYETNQIFKDRYDGFIKLSDPFLQLEYFKSDFLERQNFTFNVFVPTNKKYYDESFSFIENNEVLNSYYNSLKEMLQYIYDSMPTYIQNQQNPLNFASMKQGLKQELFNPTERNNWYLLSAISKKFREMFDWLLSFFQENNFENLSQDYNPITKKFKPKVNSYNYFKTNKASISNMFKVDIERVLANIREYNKEKLGDEIYKKYHRITKYTKFFLKELPNSIILELAEKSNIKFTNIEEAGEMLQDTYGSLIPVGKILLEDNIHKHQVEETLDFKKLMTFAYTQAAIFRAKNDAVSKIDLLIRHYKDSYEEGHGKKNIAKIESWANRALYDNREKKSKLFSSKKDLTAQELQKIANKENETAIKDVLKIIDGNLTSYDKVKNIFKSKQERDLRKKIKELSNADLTQEQIGNIKELLKREKTTYSVKAGFSKAWLQAQRLVGLGWRFSSFLMNLGAGQSINLQFDAQGTFWTPGNLAKTRWTQHSGTINFWSRGLFRAVNPGKAKKLRILIDKYQLLQDPRNTLQQSVGRQKMMKHFGIILQPFEHIQRIEYLNQSPIVHAIALDTILTGKDGKTANLIDALNSKGELKPDFKTDENIKNWEQTGIYDKKEQLAQFTAFRGKVLEAIKSAHGDYSDIAGSMLKDYLEGNLLLMFKNWWARQMHWRYHKETINMYSITDDKQTKGRYRSHNIATAMLGGTGVGLSLMFPVGAIFGFGAVAWSMGIGAGLGVGLRELWLSKEAKKELTLGPTFLSSFLTGSAITGMFALKTIGLPFHMIGLNFNKLYDEKKQVKFLVKKGLKEIDARNVMANITSVAITYNILAAMMITTMLLQGGDDDDKEEDVETTEGKRKLKNFLINNLYRLAEEINMYSHIPTKLNFLFGSLNFVRWMNDMNKLMGLTFNYLFNPDLDIDPNTGESKFRRSAAKQFPMPVSFYLTGQISSFEDIYINNQFESLTSEKQERNESKIERINRLKYRNEIKENLIKEFRESNPDKKLTQDELEKIKKKADKKTNEDMPTRRQQEIKEENLRKKRSKSSSKKSKKKENDFEDDFEDNFKDDFKIDEFEYD